MHVFFAIKTNFEKNLAHNSVFTSIHFSLAFLLANILICIQSVSYIAMSVMILSVVIMSILFFTHEMWDFFLPSMTCGVSFLLL